MNGRVCPHCGIVGRSDRLDIDIDVGSLRAGIAIEARMMTGWAVSQGVLE
ncbi:hypothetical protein [Acetobacter sp.]|nr:hypothetical protein [Acetobacter sp.]MCH4090693.1 hypothetical protein [Acetobacter sp.]MCI1300136.1 hypothetical protein [Acetobacter sp.]MCI1316554.1 hypothetical protein [Acetobacter sp.]